MRSLAITEESLPNYAQPILGAESGEFYVPPITHFIATVEDLTDMLDYASEDIKRWMAQNRQSPDVGRPPPRMTYTWWIHLKTAAVMMRKTQSRTNLLRYRRNIDVSGAPLNRVVARTAIPAPKTMIV